MLKPGRRSFYKYISPQTALATLKSRRVRYSSPLLFNDPFDIQSGLHFGFDIKTLHERVVDRLESYASSSAPPLIDPDDPWGKIVLIVREHYPSNGFPKEAIRELIEEPFKILVKKIDETRAKYQDHWWRYMLPGIRVFCVSECRDNLLMWAHYAHEHQGAVFEFLSLPEEDNPLSIAEPIQYVKQPPPFFTEPEWLDEVFSVKRLDISAFYKRYAYYKSDIWAYEREWRVWYPILPPPDSRFEDVPIRESEFAAIYFGCEAKPKFISDASSLARDGFRRIRLLRARKAQSDYRLEYMEI